MSQDAGSKFSSTAEFYSKYRPGYSDEILEAVFSRFDGRSRVLDLGCGTGQLAIPFSRRFDEVLAVDPSESMLSEARRRSDTENIEWRKGSDRDLDEIEGSFQLAVMGRSFHWMDQERTLEQLFDMIELGGGIAIFSNVEWLQRGTKEWQEEVYRVLEKYLDEVPERTGPKEFDNPWDEKIGEHGFEQVEKVEVEVERELEVEDIIGYLLSLSFCSPEKLGDSRREFEQEVRQKLKERDEDKFIQEDTETVIIGIRP